MPRDNPEDKAAPPDDGLPASENASALRDFILRALASARIRKASFDLELLSNK